MNRNCTDNKLPSLRNGPWGEPVDSFANHINKSLMNVMAFQQKKKALRFFGALWGHRL
jgi:hypothetical protein